MVEHGLYILKAEFFDLIRALGGDCDSDGGGKRPVYCCFKDATVEGLFWAIPTSNPSHRNEKQIAKIDHYISLNERDLRSCYYHRARTTLSAVYKISSCFPLIEQYVLNEFISNNVHVIMKRAEDVSEIERKLKRILAFEFRQKNYFPQRISDIRDFLVGELNEMAKLSARERIVSTIDRPISRS